MYLFSHSARVSIQLRMNLGFRACATGDVSKNLLGVGCGFGRSCAAQVVAQLGVLLTYLADIESGAPS